MSSDTAPGPAAHWEAVYTGRPPDRLGWYRPHLETSLAWIRALDLPRAAPIIDVGGGASTLVDDLLDDGFTDVTVVDLSPTALARAQARLGARAGRVRWLAGDITRLPLPAAAFVLWHDRAAFHFLVEPAAQAAYRAQLRRALRPGGHVIIGTFSLEAPLRCSGLPVQRYAEGDLHAALGAELRLERSARELHVTPGGVEQMYLYCEFLLPQRGAG
jgi:SAM-dependent methyltransferase